MVGERVMLREDHNYPVEDNNPTNTVGIITNYYNIHGRASYVLPILVQWVNGTYNSYRESDLIFISDVEPVKYIKKHNIV